MASITCIVNDCSEHIDDSMYTIGWREVSTCKVCDNASCLCANSGSCTYTVFNHYMYREDDGDIVGGMIELDFPLYIGDDVDEEVCVEEVRCRRYTVGAAYDYYMSEVLSEPLSQTMISVFSGEHKSTCFNISCFILEVKEHAVCDDDLCLTQCTEGYVDVLARSRKASSSLLQAMCMLNIDPIVTRLGDYSLAVVDGRKRQQNLDVCTSGFKWSQTCGFSLLRLHGTSRPRTVVGEHASSIRAVRTALATVSVVLTPRSMYGGKNPTTKSVSYFVHNVRGQ